VRELANALERAAILADGDVLRGQDLHVTTPLTSHDPCTLPAPLRNPLTIVPPGLVRHY